MTAKHAHLQTRAIFALIATFAFLWAPTDAHAFTLVRSSTGTVVGGWSTSNVTFDIDTSCNSYLSGVQSAIDDSAAVWNNVPSSSVVVSRGSTVSLPNPITTYVGSSATSLAPKGNAIVYCDANFASDSGLSAASIPGFATGQNISTAGSIDGCLLVLNVQSGAAANVTTVSSTLATTILAHEIGHCLGIGHSSNSEALMYYATESGRGAYLARDDIDAITYLYPKQDVVSALPGCAPVAAAATTGAMPAKPGGKNGPVGSSILNVLLEVLCFELTVGLVRFFVMLPNRRARSRTHF